MIKDDTAPSGNGVTRTDHNGAVILTASSVNADKATQEDWGVFVVVYHYGPDMEHRFQVASVLRVF